MTPAPRLRIATLRAPRRCLRAPFRTASPAPPVVAPLVVAPVDGMPSVEDVLLVLAETTEQAATDEALSMLISEMARRPVDASAWPSLAPAVARLAPAAHAAALELEEVPGAGPTIRALASRLRQVASALPVGVSVTGAGMDVARVDGLVIEAWALILDARRVLEETEPRSVGIAPTDVEAVAGHRGAARRRDPVERERQLIGYLTDHMAEAGSLNLDGLATRLGWAATTLRDTCRRVSERPEGDIGRRVIEHWLRGRGEQADLRRPHGSAR